MIKHNLKSKSDKNLSVLFKAGGQISSIKQNMDDIVSPPIHNPVDYQESYGLEIIRPKKSKKTNKLGLRSSQKLNGFDEKLPPQTPSPRLVHAIGDYEASRWRKTHSR